MDFVNHFTYTNGSEISKKMAEFPSSTNLTKDSHSTAEESISSENTEISCNHEWIISTITKYINDGETYKAITMLKSYEAELVDDYLSLWDIRNLLGNAYCHLNDYENALSYYQDNIHLSRNNLIDKLREMIGLANIGNIYKTIGQFDLAIYYYKELAEIDKTSKDNFFRKEAFICIGDTYFAKSHFLMKNNHNQLTVDVKLNMHNAIHSYYRALEMFDIDTGSTIIHHKIAEVWYCLKDYKLCIIMNEKILELIQIFGNKIYEVQICRHLGDLCGMTYQYDKSIVYYHKALQIATTLDMFGEKARLVFNLGNIYVLQGNWKLAVNYHSEHVRIAELINDPERVLLALSSLTTVLITVGNYNDAKVIAYSYYEKAKELNNLQEMNSAITFIEEINRNEAIQREQVVKTRYLFGNNKKRRYRKRQLFPRKNRYYYN